MEPETMILDAEVTAETTPVEETIEETIEETQPTETPPIVPKQERDFEKDKHFAKIRREKEALEKQLAEASEAKRALSLLFPDVDDPVIHAESYYYNKDLDEIKAQREQLKIAQENDALKNRLLEIEAERLMEKDLEEIRKIDPTIKSLDDLDEDFFSLIKTGALTATQAYFATKAIKGKLEAVPPKAIGYGGTKQAAKEFYTSDEVDKLTEKDLANPKIMEAVLNSMGKW